MNTQTDRAIVIGGSIAGLLSARVLADHFSVVTIVERDRFPPQPQARRGVPQSVQPHVLFARGYQILQELFPTIETELVAQGAVKIDWVREFFHFGEAGWSANAQSPSDVVSFTCSRPLLEWTIRNQLKRFGNVQFMEEQRVTQLLYNANKESIVGVSLRSVDATEQNLEAALVVDASGRRSKTPHWLRDIGFSPPPQTVVDPFLGYATRRYKPKGVDVSWKVMLISQSPPDNTRLGYLARIEGGEWIATLGGYGRDFPPLDHAGFLEFAHSLASPAFSEAIALAEPSSSIVAHRATANRLYHYEKIRLPHGLIALGDAVCALCPVYGQGMTVSALGAMVLRHWLKRSFQRGLDVNRFQKKLAKSNALSWSLATAQDSRFPTTAGRIETGFKGDQLLQRYTARLMRKTTSDPHLHTRLTEVAHLLRSPLWLYHPDTVFRVLR